MLSVYRPNVISYLFNALNSDLYLMFIIWSTAGPFYSKS